MAGEKASVEEHVASLDGSVERLEKRVETLVGEKGLLEEQVKQQAGLLAVDESRRKIVEGDMSWPLWDGIV